MVNIRSDRKKVTFLLIIALLFNAIFPLLTALNNYSESKLSGIDELFSDRILICTSSGFKYISLKDYEEGNFPDDNDPRPHCPLCTINAAITDKFLPTITKIEFPRFSGERIYYFTDKNYILSPEWIKYNKSRAPPYSS